MFYGYLNRPRVSKIISAYVAIVFALLFLQGILDSSIKITNEPPTEMMANIHKALDNFNQETLEMCSKEAEFKAILFSLCYFLCCYFLCYYASIQERSKFGAQGWIRSYPFNVGDLTISVNVLYNYLEANNKVPWEDLRYLFGEIMYGGRRSHYRRLGPEIVPHVPRSLHESRPGKWYGIITLLVRFGSKNHQFLIYLDTIKDN